MISFSILFSIVMEGYEIFLMMLPPLEIQKFSGSKNIFMGTSWQIHFHFINPCSRNPLILDLPFGFIILSITHFWWTGNGSGYHIIFLTRILHPISCLGHYRLFNQNSCWQLIILSSFRSCHKYFQQPLPFHFSFAFRWLAILWLRFYFCNSGLFLRANHQFLGAPTYIYSCYHRHSH